MVQILLLVQELPPVVAVEELLVTMDLLVVLAVVVVVVQRLVELDLRVVMAAVPSTLDQLDGLLAAAVVQEVIPVTPKPVLELLFLSQEVLRVFVAAVQEAMAHLDLLTVQVTRDLMDIAMDPLFLVLQLLVVLLTPLVVEVEIVLTHLERVLAVVVIHNPILLIAVLVATVLPISEFPKTS